MAIQDSEVSTTLKIGYYDPFDVFKLIQPSIESKLPLTNLHWKSPAHNSNLKSIPNLPVNLVEEVPKRSKVLDDDVLTRLMFIQCESIDIYKSQVRPLIKEWLRHLVRNTQCEWLIVLYVPLHSKDTNYHLIKTNIYNKLKTDFEKDGKYLAEVGIQISDDIDRCFRLKDSNDNELNKLETYSHLIASLKELILLAFTNRFQTLNHKLSLPKNGVDLSFLNLELDKADLFNKLFLFLDSLAIYNKVSIDLNDFHHGNNNLFSQELPQLDLSNFNIADLFKIDIKELFSGETSINLFNVKCFLFSKKIDLLISIIKNEPLLSIKALKIADLFQHLIMFLSDLSFTFKDQVIELSFILIDYYTNLPLIVNIFNSEVNTEVDLSNIFDFRGELKLLQRSNLSKLGHVKGYSVYGFNEMLSEVSLDGNDPQPINLNNQGLIKILDSEENFLNCFETLTEFIIQDFVKSGRSKTIDVLSIDLALLNYQRKNYKESLNILQDSYRFFISNGWTFMGGILLEIYIDCVEKLDINNDSLYFLTYFELFSNLSFNSNKVDINNYKLTKSSNKVEKLFKKIIESSNSLPNRVERNIDKLFGIKLHPFIFKHKETDYNKYYIDLDWSNLYDIDFTFKSIKLELSDGLIFSDYDVSISKNESQRAKLFSNVYSDGAFKPIKLIVEISDKLSLIHDFSQEHKHNYDNNMVTIVSKQNSIINDSLVNNSQILPEAFTSNIHYYPDIESFNGEIIYPQSVDLGKNSLILKITNGKSDIESIKFDISSDIEGLTIHYSDMKLSLSSLKRCETYSLLIPYEYSGDDKTVSMQTNIFYKCGGEQYSYFTSAEVDTSLAVSVSVQDIFKANSIFSRFQIGSSDPKYPLKLVSCNFTSDDNNYSIEYPRSTPKNMVVFDEQSYSSFYRIIPKERNNVGSEKNFLFLVEYSSLHEECLEILEKNLLKSFPDLIRRNYFLLLKKMISKHLNFDIQAYIMYNKVKVIVSTETKEIIDHFINIVEESERATLKNILSHCFNEDHTAEPDAVQIRKLSIGVPPPNIDILQLIEFDYKRKSHYLVGEPISMELKVESTTKWSLKQTDQSGNGDISIIAESSTIDETTIEGNMGNNEKEFLLSMANDENWLLSGFTRKNFTVELNSNYTLNKFKLMLIPLTAGKLPLPKIFIKSNDDKELPMDISVKNGSETLLVVPDLDRMTFSF